MFHVFYSFYYKTIHKSSPNYGSLICYNFFYIHAIEWLRALLKALTLYFSVMVKLV